jgi:hypothetical protein
VSHAGLSFGVLVGSCGPWTEFTAWTKEKIAFLRRLQNRFSEEVAKMGYTTEFEGRFELDKSLSTGETRYLKVFAASRPAMMGNPNILKTLDDPIRSDVGLPLGEDGCYFIGDNRTGFTAGSPPNGQPGEYCNWIISSDRQGIEWNGQEKFYNYTSLGCNTL